MICVHVQVTVLLNKYLERFAMAPVFSEEEVEHYLLPVDDVVDAYVVQDPGERHSCLSFPFSQTAREESSIDAVLDDLGVISGLHGKG